MNTNIIYNDDNINVMKRLSDKSIDLIYCDILYGTGKKFKDYQDLKPVKSEIYSHYVPRLEEMHRILKDTGTIYLQMGIQINHWIRCIMDDIFGYDNFRNEIIVTFNLGGRGSKEFAKKHDVIIVYSKSDKFVFNDMHIRVPYKSVISKKQDRPNISQEKLKIGTIPTNVWGDIPNGFRVKKMTDYFSEKHEKILDRIIKASSNEGDIVADFYCGSGTTLAVAKKLNRNFIGCDINRRAVEISNYRIENVTNKANNFL